MKWLEKKRAEVLADWRATRIGYAQAVQRLTDLDVPYAEEVVART